MGYCFKHGESVESGLKRIVREQIDRALAELADPAMDRHDAVHQVRKRCKKIRGLLRLVRPAFKPDFAAENAWYRDAARELAWVRDAQSILETHLRLADRFGGQLDEHAVAQVSAWLSERRDRATADAAALDAAVERFRSRMVDGRRRVAGWTLTASGFDAVAGGLAKTYARGRRAMKTAYEAADTVHFHDWRKRVKYHWYHLRLLQPVNPALVKAQRDQADRIGERLGEEHDLALLRDLLAADDDCPIEARTVQTVLALIDRRRAQLRRKVRQPGALLYCEKPKQLLMRFGCYWKQHAG